jgi:hypothetical protein
MKRNFKYYLSVSLVCLTGTAAFSLSNIAHRDNQAETLQHRAAGCAPATALTKMEFNNVSALLETGGSMWQDRATGNSAYEVPKGSGLKVIFAGALWMGGLDFNDQLKIAALTFRTANDFWTGPLTTTGDAEIDEATCLQYDKFYTTLRQDIITFNAYNEAVEYDAINGTTTAADNFPGYSTPASILNWPAHGDVGLGQDYHLAPFYDKDNDDVYNPDAGDYPWYDINKDLACGNDRTVTLYGDQNFWWVFNDKGNIHTETGGDPIGMEIHAQAFAFATNDEVNDMTFYNYELINRSTQTLYNTYFGQWVDADLGGAIDDYVGCDVQRGLGYAYNGDNFDDPYQGQLGYGANPPAVGVDFFEGPYQDNDNMDNPLTENISDAIDSLGIPYPGLGIGYGDGVVDNERFGMRKFLYYNNAGQGGNPNQTDPNNGTDYYNYLRGIWLDGTRFVYGGSAHPSSPDAIANGLVECDYMFPGDSDPLNWGTSGISVPGDWTEVTAGNQPNDRRFMQSAGPFVLLPGSRNNITVGVVYARSATGSSFASVEKLRVSDDKAQALFDNCFRVLDGPDAPDLTIQEMNQEVIIYLSNPLTGNNYNEMYSEQDPFIISPDTVQYDDSFRFQGYKIYQLANKDVSSSDLGDPDLARLIAQCDIKDTVADLVNFELDESIGYLVPELKVDAANNGIAHSFKITQDAYTQAKLVNHKTYYYMAVAYAFNEYREYDPNDPTKLDGQKKPYLESRKSPTGAIRVYEAIPHMTVVEMNGTQLSAEYGDGPKITRIEGQGNGSLILELTDASEQDIVTNFKTAEIQYENNYGPVNVKVVDPLNVVGSDFELRFHADTLSGGDGMGVLNDGDTWTLKNLATGETWNSDRSIAVGNEQIIPELGISITIGQYYYAERNNGSSLIAEPLGAFIEYADSSVRWLSGINDQEGNSELNWIRVGTQNQDIDASTYPDPQDDPAQYNDYIGEDDQEQFEGLLEGTWAPFRFCSATGKNCIIDTVYSGTRSMSQVRDVQSVDIVFTSDKTKWTRCPVIEAQDAPNLAEGDAAKMELREHASVDKDGNPDGTGDGMGWFPGYAIDVETGERLNIAFSENSWFAVDNGRDMKFNPTQNVFSGFDMPMGGGHTVFIFRNQDKDFPGQNRMGAYDGGANIETKMKGSSADKIKVWRSCMWVGRPIPAEGYSWLQTDAKVKLRVSKPYQLYATNNLYLADSVGNSTNNWLNLYEFSTGDLATEFTNGGDLTDSILALINVVPNPYYAYSAYESSKLDTRVKITNLPDVANIKIFSPKGELVRTLTKDSPVTSIDWDLKNLKGIPVASGLYLIHVEIPDLGEVVLKSMVFMRPPNLENF